MSYAFQCRNCGHLEEGAHAGDRAVPRGCRHCGAGVRWEIDAGNNPTLIDDPDNWLVLDKLDSRRLKQIYDKFRIGPDDVAPYHPKGASTATRAPVHVVRSAEETLGTEDATS